MEQRNSSIFSFKHFLKKICLPWILISVVVGAVFNYFFERKIILGSEISGSYKMNKLISEVDVTEIPFFGSSRCEGTFIPDSLVKNGFNYGINGTQDDVLLFCLREECKKNKSTPVIMNFDLDGLNHSIGDLANYIYNSDYPAVQLLLGPKYEPIFKVPLLKYYGHFETYTKYYLNDIFNLTKFTNNGAAIEKNVLSEKKLNELIRERMNTASSFENDPVLLAGLLSVFDAHPERHFIVVVTPYHPSCFNRFGNYDEAVAFLNGIDSLDNVTVLNFAKAPYPDSCFINTTHLNLTGARIFNRALRDSLGLYLQ